MKFTYSTRLNPSDKGTNRISLIGDGVVLMVVDGRRTIFNINIQQLPFTAAIKTSHIEVSNNTEHEYYNIGTRPEQPFTLTDTDLLHINYTMFLMAMRRAQARHTWIKSLPNYFTSYVRESIMASNYIHRMKLVTLQGLVNGWSPMTHMPELRQLYMKHGFPAETAMLYLLYWRSGEAQQTIKGLLEIREPFVLDFESLLEEANLIVAESNLGSLANYEAAKKLSFIVRSHRMQVGDFGQELHARARLVYMGCRPFLGRQHAINYARSTISTYALRIINHFKSEDKQRLLTTADGGYNNRFEELNESYASDFSEDDIIDQIDQRRELLGDAYYAR